MEQFCFLYPVLLYRSVQGQSENSCALLVDPYNGKVHQTGRYFGTV